MEKDGFHTLPPAKRFMHLQHSSPPSLPIPKPSPLPAKKRVDPRKESAFTTTASYCLPAKKRVWAPHPPFTPLDASSEDESESHPPKKQPRPPPTLPDLNEVEDPDEDDPVLEKAEEATGGVEEEEEDGIVCCICSSTDGDPSDPIVFCDGCDLTVHSTCYGDPLVRAVPDGDWFCSRCDLPKEDGEKSVDTDCFLCPVKGGATKPAVDGRWAHIACSLLVPEVFFKDAQGREGVDCSRVPRRRWEGMCYICSTTNGCVIDCSEPKCSLLFHVGCGLNEDLCIEYREGRGGALVAGFCNVHTQLWHKVSKLLFITEMLVYSPRFTILIIWFCFGSNNKRGSSRLYPGSRRGRRCEFTCPHYVYELIFSAPPA